MEVKSLRFNLKMIQTINIIFALKFYFLKIHSSELTLYFPDLNLIKYMGAMNQKVSKC